jgi:hypothetical protein
MSPRHGLPVEPLGEYNLISDRPLTGIALARDPTLDWSDPYRRDPPGYEPDDWEIKFDEAHRLLEERGVKIRCGDPQIDLLIEQAKREGRW